MSLKVDEMCRATIVVVRGKEKTAPVAVTVGRSYLCLKLILSKKVRFLSKT